MQKNKPKKSSGLKKFSEEKFSQSVFLKPKKNFGQNFLKSKEALRAMCTSSELKSTDTVIEIGPGKGALTAYLLGHAGKIIAIEKDRDLIPILSEKFQEEIKSGKLIIVEGDILTFDPESQNLKPAAYKIVANIPYNITGAIIKRFLSETVQPKSMTLLVQKEVAERIVARPATGGAGGAKESILSLSVKAYGTPHYIMKVSKRFFSPEPKVDSAIIHISDISKQNFKDINTEERFFTIIKAGFAHKRKVLRKNLEEIAPIQAIDSVFQSLGIKEKARAEDISFPVWLSLSQNLNHI